MAARNTSLLVEQIARGCQARIEAAKTSGQPIQLSCAGRVSKTGRQLRQFRYVARKITVSSEESEGLPETGLVDATLSVGHDDENGDFLMLTAQGTSGQWTCMKTRESPARRREITTDWLEKVFD
jgi:hypothetical protein